MQPAPLLPPSIKSPTNREENRRRLDNTVVVKRLAAGAPGTKRLQSRYGDNLVCVRYRDDPNTGNRLTTVELIIDERPPNPRILWVDIGYAKAELCRQIIAAGGTWNNKTKIWRIPPAAVTALGLDNYVVPRN